jgi:hypothetical protein
MKIIPYFKSELDLVNTFCTFLKNGGLPTDAGVVIEFESSHGIADIVIYGSRELLQPHAAIFANVPPRYAVIFGRELLPKVFSVQQFIDLTGASEDASIRVLNILVKQGILQRLEKRVYECLFNLKNPLDVIISIEAKLSDWRRALRQAYRYREFSNQSWVLMDTFRVSAAMNNIHLFVRSGVGLASINTAGELFIHHEPSVTSPLSESRYWTESVQLIRHHVKNL